MLSIFVVLLPLAQSAVVQLTYGAVQGAEPVHPNGVKYHAFKKVPYAAPPLGALRFAPPAPVDPWYGVLDATKYGPACMSNSSETSSPQKWIDEDCLHLNIFTSEKCLMKGDCPVTYYIHGGSLYYDSAVMFNDTRLYETFVSEDIVMVIVGFRLGIFSHLTFATQDVVPYNLAIYDLLQGLSFVQSEIEKFGGNKSKVTIFGHSFGANLVDVLAFTPNLAKGHFSQAVSMSGALQLEERTVQINVTKGFAERAKCWPEGQTIPNITHDIFIVDCLRKIDQFELLRIQRELEDEGAHWPSGLMNEGPLLPGGDIQNLIKNPKQIPLLLGTTLREFDFSNKSLDLVMLFDFENRNELRAKFQKDYDDGYFGETTYETMLVYLFCKMLANSMYRTGAPVYLYSFRDPKKSFHTDDLSYLLGIHSFEQDSNQKVIQRLYPKYFTNFIKFGTPGPAWPKFNPILDPFYSINVDFEKKELPHAAIGYEKKVIDYWFKEMRAVDKSITTAKKRTRTDKMIELSPIREEDYAYMTLGFAMIVFLIGACLGRYVFPKRQDVYIQMIDERTPLFSYEKGSEMIF